VQLSLLDIAVHRLTHYNQVSLYLEPSKDIVDQMSSVLISHHLPEEHSRLSKIAVRVSWLISSDQSGHLELAGLGIRSHLERSESVRLVVWFVALVAIDSHRPVSLSIGDFRSVGAVNWDLKHEFQNLKALTYSKLAPNLCL
jgi:hypothetical protein